MDIFFFNGLLLLMASCMAVVAFLFACYRRLCVRPSWPAAAIVLGDVFAFGDWVLKIMVSRLDIVSVKSLSI